MAQVAKSIADVLTELADNTSGNINPERVRNAVMSLVPDYGVIYLTTPRVIGISSSLTWYSCHDPTVISAVLGESFGEETGMGGLQYVGISSIRNILLFASVSVTSVNATQELEFRFCQNTTVDVVHSHQEVITSTAYTNKNLNLLAIISAPVTNTSWRVEVRNRTTASNVTISHLVMAGIAFPKYLS